MSLFRVFFYVCFLPALCIYSRPTYSAGGISLALSHQMMMSKVNPQAIPKALPRVLERNLTKEMVMPIADDVTPKDFAHEQTGLDPEYQAILDDFDKRKKLFQVSHRDVQWQIVARSFNHITNVDERLELIDAVRRYPFWRELPPTAAMSPNVLIHWLRAKEDFFREIVGKPTWIDEHSLTSKETLE